jgi:Xaa-Pro aminopeptidase
MHLPWWWSPAQSAALERRRSALLAALGPQAALVVAGLPHPRNYAANTFPFRPNSHFLYLFGWGPPGAAAVLADGRATVFAPPAADDDALWSGPVPSLGEWAELLGVPVESIHGGGEGDVGRGGGLAAHLAEATRRFGPVATLPAPDAATAEWQSALLGRPVRPGSLTPIDVSLADAVIRLRLAHDAAAVGELAVAAAATARAHAAGLEATRPGLRESAVRGAMEGALIAEGCGTAYGSIVTVHGEVLHNETHHNLLRSGDLILADVGAETASGWAGDVTRTWPVSGRFSTPQAELYDVVLAAQEHVIAAVRPGVRYRDLHLLATATLARGLAALGIVRGDPAERATDGTVALLFPHGVGHLLGLDVHDMEDLGDRAGYAPGRARGTEPGVRYLRLDRDLEPGMAVTVEPGIYFVPAILDTSEVRARFADRLDWATLELFRGARGIRIEDDVLVTPDGHHVLTAAIPKHRNILETSLEVD